MTIRLVREGTFPTSQLMDISRSLKTKVSVINADWEFGKLTCLSDDAECFG